MGIYSREEVVDMGPDEYREVPVEEKVRQDIAQNANAVDFDEAVETDIPVSEKPQETANTQPENVVEEPTKEEPKMKARPKKKPDPEPEVEDEIEIQPEWA